MKLPGAPAVQLPQGIESLRGRKDTDAVRAVAREMESLFAYEMVKAMRAASGGPASGEGFGGEVYGSMFDMELARVLSSRGLGLQEMLLKGMGHTEYSGKAVPPPAGEEDSAAPSIPPRAASKVFAPPAPAVSGPHTGEPLEENPRKAVSAPPIAAPPPVVSAPPAVASPPAPQASLATEPDVPVPAPSRAEAPGTPAPSAPALSGEHSHEPDEEGAFPIRDGGRISSAFGYRKDPFTGEAKFHHGVDIAAPEGTAVYPARGGEVKFSGYQKGYGNVVVVDHGNGFVTKYAHNRANRVATGDRVGPETVIAEVGSTGRSTGPHLHFEVQYEGKKVPPLAVFAGIAKGRGGSSDKYS